MATHGKTPYNILLITVDQETYLGADAPGPDLPAHSRLRKEGVSFERHYINAAICTPSRSVMFTGQHIPHTAMWDNTDFSWQQDLDPSIQTVGHLFRKIGYKTAYKGKWHLARTVDANKGDTCLKRMDSMEPYGFSDYSLSGDEHGGPLSGYYNDHAIAANAVRWLRTSGERLCSDGAPWFLAVNFINPHDIMRFDADAPGVHEMKQSTRRAIRRAPDRSSYRTVYPEYPVPTTTGQPFSESGRPGAHARYQAVKDQFSGTIGGDAASWERYKDYYLNCIKDVDVHVSTVLNELDELGMTENTVVVYTSDHGEMMGAHGIRGKGPFVYDENVHVPMFIRHPDIQGGQLCDALSCHTDLVPTLLGLSGLPADRLETLTGGLPGHDLSRALVSPSTMKENAFRPGVLFCFNMMFLMGSENQIENEEDHPQPNTFNKGVEFIRTNCQEDNWFLHVETFDPHEPFYSHQKYKDLYQHEYYGPHFEWPDYAPVTETPEQIAHCRYEYAAVVSMCDEYLGRVLDVMDEKDLWKDTMLIVNADHGFLLGEHNWWGKKTSPFYNEVATMPLFIWDPRPAKNH